MGFVAEMRCRFEFATAGKACPASQFAAFLVEMIRRMAGLFFA
jgi:hypothetical protein